VDGLRWLGLEWDEGPDVGGPYAPYRQSERVERHVERAGELLASGHAYRCFCTLERLAAAREAQEARKETPRYDQACRDLSADDVARRVAAGEPYAVRFRVPVGETTFEDMVRGTVTFAHEEVDDWVMVRQVGGPTYNFVVVCDDIDMRITEVLRGEEHLVNTPKQLLLYRAFGAPAPSFGHLPLMLGPNRKKLSKRHGDTALGDYRAKGYPREAIVNFLCLQGWALDGSTELFDVDTFVARFDPRDVQKAGAVFDFDKFRWLAGEVVRRQSVAVVAERCAPFVVTAGLMGEAELADRHAWFARVVAGEQERIQLYSELPDRIAHYFAPRRRSALRAGRRGRRAQARRAGRDARSVPPVARRGAPRCGAGGARRRGEGVGPGAGAEAPGALPAPAVRADRHGGGARPLRCGRPARA
jgi:nondiscriminating glutamyl-tRNA synthetase